MKREVLIITLALLSIQFAFSQVPKKVVVEHFTNTYCSICASKNPGFYTNLKKQVGVIHLAVHPSSPYASCTLNKHNTTENDGRTNYYGVYGGTPRLVIQGTVIGTNADYNSAALFTPYTGKTSPASITIKQSKFGADSIRSTITITTKAVHALGNLKLFVALAEDTIFQTTNNGETKHYDVFRKSLTGYDGKVVMLPSKVGDSIVFSAKSAVNPVWKFQRIYTLAILQEESNKAVVQAEAVPASKNDHTSGVTAISKAFEVSVFPNPVNEQLSINLKTPLPSKARLYAINGKLIIEKDFQNQLHLNLQMLSKGQYFLIIENELGSVTENISKQ